MTNQTEPSRPVSIDGIDDAIRWMAAELDAHPETLGSPEATRPCHGGYHCPDWVAGDTCCGCGAEAVILDA